MRLRTDRREQHGRSGPGDTRHAMMLGNPKPFVSETFRVLRAVDRLPECCCLIGSRAHV